MCVYLIDLSAQTILDKHRIKWPSQNGAVDMECLISRNAPCCVKHEKLIKFMVCLPKRHAPNRFYFNGMNQMNVWVWKTNWLVQFSISLKCRIWKIHTISKIYVGQICRKANVNNLEQRQIEYRNVDAKCNQNFDGETQFINWSWWRIQLITSN